MQLEILKLTLKKSMKNILELYVILTISFIVLLVLNKYPSEYFTYIIGKLNITNQLSILFWLFNIAFIILMVYKYLTFDIKNMPYSIILRENNRKWIIKKILGMIILVVLLKIFEYLYFYFLSVLFNLKISININFYLLEIYLNISYSIFLLMLILLINKLLSGISVISIIFAINRMYFLSVSLNLLSLLLTIYLYKYQKK